MSGFLPVLFQSTLPYGSDQSNAHQLEVQDLFQSTLPYGSDHDDETMLYNYPISIHAPLRERHAKAATIDTKRLISIHAPLRERLVLQLALC